MKKRKAKGIVKTELNGSSIEYEDVAYRQAFRIFLK